MRKKVQKHRYEVKFIPICKSFVLKGFTIVELLVVIAIIGILAAMLLPALKLAKAAAQSSLCGSNQKQCGYALTGYAMDFNDWVLGGQCSSTYAVYPNLGPMMMGFGYAPKMGTFTDASVGDWFDIPFGAVFQCPSLSHPDSYKEGNSGRTRSSTWQSYGLRIFTDTRYFPKEIISPANASNCKLIKFPSLYMPSDIPYMVDTVANVPYPDGTGLAGYTQCYYWSMPAGDFGNGFGRPSLHMRHNKRANVWFPDGHVGSWGYSDLSGLLVPNAGSFGSPNYKFGYSY